MLEEDCDDVIVAPLVINLNFRIRGADSSPENGQVVAAGASWTV